MSRSHFYYDYLDVDTAWIAATQSLGWLPAERLPFSYDAASCALTVVEELPDGAKSHGWCEAKPIQNNRHFYQGYVIYVQKEWYSYWRADIFASLPTEETNQPLYEILVEDRTCVTQHHEPETPRWHGRKGALDKAKWAIDSVLLGASCLVSEESSEDTD